MVLCATCKGFDIQSFNKKNKFTQSLELTLVAIAATEGCSFCKFLYMNKPQADRRLNDEWIILRMKTAEEIGYDMWPSGPGARYTQMQVWIGPKTSTWRSSYFKDFRVVSNPGSAADLSGDIPRTYIGNKSDSEHHFNVLRQWLVDCQSRSHSLCNGTIPGDVLIDDNFHVPLPSRLISVGYPGDKMVYLRQTKGEKGAYITLSYVRGYSGTVPETSASNLEERENGILVSSLPKTFQDVITITRKLNVPYVWIDALCIIQDDQGDWNREVSQMSRIYQFSLLTVAATGAEDVSKGCFLDRAPSPLDKSSRVELPYRTKEGIVSGTFSVFEQHASFEEEYERFVERSPLLKRAWVFQERVLSRRMVHYTKGKMFFECRTNRFMNECLEGVEEQHTRIGFWGPEIKKGFKSSYTGPRAKFLGDPYETSVLGRWYMAVSMYSKLSLSKKEDTLAAIAGAAKEFRLLLSLERDNVGKPGAGRDASPLHPPLYISGLWSHDLLYGLSWYPSQPQKLQIAGNKAPSWSWSSWQTPIEWPGSQVFKAESKLVFLGLQEHFAKSAAMKLNPRERIPLSILSDFETYIPRQTTPDTITTSIPSLQITGKIREIWRKPQDANYLTSQEREEFITACSLNAQEKQWLTRCHAIYTDENAEKAAGFGCFEDYWLVKSMDTIMGSEINAGMNEDEAVAMLLSLNEGNGTSESAEPGTAGPSSGVDDELERAIAASLGKGMPIKKTPETTVDPDEEFNDQLAIALMLSAEENSIGKTLPTDSGAGGAASPSKAGKGKETEEDKSKIKPDETNISADTREEPVEEVQNNELASTQEADSSSSQESQPSPESNITERPTPAPSTERHQISEQETKHTHSAEVMDPNPSDTADIETSDSSTHIPPAIPPRSSSTPLTTLPEPIPSTHPSLDATPSLATTLQHLPQKLHCLPLFSTKAPGNLSYLGLTPTIYTVLLLRLKGRGEGEGWEGREGWRVFERIGVGRIVERGMGGGWVWEKGGKGEVVVLV